MQSSEILELAPKVKFLLVFQAINWQNLASFGQWEGLEFVFQIWVIENP
jgi:hypothetical protein